MKPLALNPHALIRHVLEDNPELDRHHAAVERTLRPHQEQILKEAIQAASEEKPKPNASKTDDR